MKKSISTAARLAARKGRRALARRIKLLEKQLHNTRWDSDTFDERSFAPSAVERSGDAIRLAGSGELLMVF